MSIYAPVNSWGWNLHFLADFRYGVALVVQVLHEGILIAASQRFEKTAIDFFLIHALIVFFNYSSWVLLMQLAPAFDTRGCPVQCNMPVTPVSH